jgi:hypothetical protein
MLMGTVTIFLVSLPTRFAALAAMFERPTPTQQAMLRQLPFGLLDARSMSGMEVTVTILFLALAAIIIWHRSDDWVALIIAATLAGYVAWANPAMQTLAGTQSPWQLPARAIQAAGMLCTVAFLYMYPDGRFTPRWTRLLMIPLALWVVAWVLLPHSIFDLSQPGYISVPSFIVLMGWLTTGVAALIYRYAHAATSIQRRQIAPILGSAILGVAVYAVLYAAHLMLPTLQAAAGAGDRVDPFRTPIFLLTMLLVPAGFALAIFRFRALDIELLVNRALVYGALTAIVAGLYPTSTGFFERLFVAVTGDHSEAATVASTLLVASLMAPLRTRLQVVVDLYMKQPVDQRKAFQGFARSVREVIDVLDVEVLTREVLNQAVGALRATGGAVYLERNGHFQLAHATGEWDQIEGLASWLESHGIRYGWVVLGPRQDGMEYTSQEQRMFVDSVSVAARAMDVAARLRKNQFPTAEASIA